MNLIGALITAGATIIVGGLAFAGVIITNNKANDKMQNDMKVSQAVTDTKLEALTAEVHLHNNFAQRIPTLEQEQVATNRRLKNLEDAVQPIAVIETEIEDILRRVKALEGYHKPH